MTPRPCIICGAPCEGARCEQHKLPARPKASPSARGYDRRWQAISRWVRAMSPVCANCGATSDLTVDHLRPGKVVESLDDVQVLCRRCNARKGKPNQGGDPLPGVAEYPAPEAKFLSQGGAE